MYCPNCGTEQEPANAFCSKCGTQLPKQTEVSSKDLAEQPSPPVATQNSTHQRAPSDNSRRSKSKLPMIAGVAIVLVALGILVNWKYTQYQQKQQLQQIKAAFAPALDYDFETARQRLLALEMQPATQELIENRLEEVTQLKGDWERRQQSVQILCTRILAAAAEGETETVTRLKSVLAADPKNLRLAPADLDEQIDQQTQVYEAKLKAVQDSVKKVQQKSLDKLKKAQQALEAGDYSLARTLTTKLTKDYFVKNKAIELEKLLPPKWVDQSPSRTVKKKSKLLAWSPEGQYVASLTDITQGNKTFEAIQVWDAATFDEVQSFDGHESPIQGFAWSPDGTKIASVSSGSSIQVYINGSQPTKNDLSVRIWSVETGRELRRIDSKSLLHSVAWSPDGNTLTTVDDSNNVKLWDTTTGRKIRTLKHDFATTVSAWSPDGTKIATQGCNALAIWDASTEERKLYEVEHPEAITAISWSPDGKQLATASEDYTLRIWSCYISVPTQSPTPQKRQPGISYLVAAADSLSCKHLLEGHENEVTGVAWSPDGNTIASISKDKTIRFWDAQTGCKLACLSNTQGHADGVLSLAFSPDGKILVTGSNLETKRWWVPHYLSNRPLRVARGQYDLAIRKKNRGKLAEAIAILKNIKDNPFIGKEATPLLEKIEKELTQIRQDSAQRYRDANQNIGYAGWLTHLALSPDGKKLATSKKNKACIWSVDVSWPSLEKVIEGHTENVNDVAWSPDGKTLVTGSDDKTVRLWDPATGSEVRKLDHQEAVRCVAWSPDGKTLVSTSGGSRGTDKYDVIRLFNTSNSFSYIDMKGHSAVRKVAWAPDSKTMASADYGEIQIWNMHTRQEINRLEGSKTLTNPVEYLAWIPNGQQVLAAVYENGTIRIWNTSTGKSMQTINCKYVNAVAWSPDGKMLASASGGGNGKWTRGSNSEVCIWDAATGQKLLVMDDFLSHAVELDWSPNGKILYTGSHWGIIRRWWMSYFLPKHFTQN